MNSTVITQHLETQCFSFHIIHLIHNLLWTGLNFTLPQKLSGDQFVIIELYAFQTGLKLNYKLDLERVSYISFSPRS